MMRYAIASHAMLATIDIDESFRVRDWRVLSRGYHYGIGIGSADTGPGRLRAYRGGDSVYRQDAPTMLTFGTDGATTQLAAHALDPLGDVHQIVPYGRGMLLADTAHDRLVVGQGAQHATFDFGDGENDVHHVNSIFPLGPGVLVLLHNRRRRESQVAVLDARPDRGFELAALLSLWDVMCHNVYVEGDRLLYNASYVNELVEVDLRSDRVARRISLDVAASDLPSGRGHVKGLSISSDYLALGVSEEASRDHRPSSDGVLALLDRSSLELAAVVPLDVFPIPIGNINEVRRLDTLEMAQGGPGIYERDWSRLRLAERQRLARGSLRLRGRLLDPLYRAKARLDGYRRDR